jgi:hypothetical protein
VTILKHGDRVRVTKSNRVPGYHAGDKGCVISGPNSSVFNNLPYYVVSMDKDGILNTATLFTEGEIELDDAMRGLKPVRGIIEINAKESAPRKIGVRVRVTNKNRQARYHPGDKGTVISGPNCSDEEMLIFYVAMDKVEQSSNIAIFIADEIEPDV